MLGFLFVMTPNAMSFRSTQAEAQFAYFVDATVLLLRTGFPTVAIPKGFCTFPRTLELRPYNRCSVDTCRSDSCSYHYSGSCPRLVFGTSSKGPSSRFKSLVYTFPLTFYSILLSCRSIAAHVDSFSVFFLFHFSLSIAEDCSTSYKV